jgi:hypothetical protein
MDYAIEEFRAVRPASWSPLVWFVQSEFHLGIQTDNLRKIPPRNANLRLNLGQPMETQRAQASADTIAAYFDNRRHVLQDLRRGFL